MKTRKSVLLLFSTLLVCALLPSGVSALEIEAITRPSADIALSFVQSGKVRDVSVVTGDRVKPGQILAHLEDSVEMVQYEIYTRRAEDMTRIEMAAAELLQKEKDLERMEAAQKEGAVPDLEVEHARLARDTARLAAERARFEHEQDILKKKEIRAILDQLHLVSPISGVVERVDIEKGESLQALVPAVHVVSVDPLHLDVAVPLGPANMVKPGQMATVRSADGTEAAGRIEYISSVADAAANTLMVRVGVANPAHRPAGERVMVIFPDGVE